VLGVGDRCLLEALRVGHVHVRPGHPLHGGVEVVEGLLGDQSRQIRSDTSMRPALLDHHHPVGLPHRLEDRVEVEWPQRPGVDHLGLGAVLVGERLRRFLRGLRHPEDSDDGDVRSLTADGGLTEVEDLAVLGNVSA
jgi:hypothetical protein